MTSQFSNYYQLTNHTFSIDKLKICFRHNNEYISQFTEDFFTDSFVFSLIENTDDILCYNVYVNDSNDLSISLGILSISKSLKYESLTFFQFTNYSLYHIFGYSNNIPYNGLYFLNQIIDKFKLQFNSVTSLEIALDSKFNIISKVRKYIHNFKDYDLVLNGKVIKDENEYLKQYGEYYSRCRKSITRRPTLYFEQKNKSFGIRIYDKATEIESSNKGYISDSKAFYRTELYIKHTDIKEFCSSLANTELDLYSYYDSILNFLLDDEFLFLVFFKFAKRSIYFIDKMSKIRIYLSDINRITNKFRRLIPFVA